MSHLIRSEATLWDGSLLVVVTEILDAVPPHELSSDTESVEFSWTEGNRSCDCQRALMISRAVPGYLAGERCGDRIELVSLSATFDDGLVEILV